MTPNSPQCLIVDDGVYRIRIAGTRIKAWNRSTYYLLEWLLIGGLVYVIFV